VISMGNREPQFPIARTTMRQRSIEDHYDNLRPKDNAQQPSRYGYITRVVEDLEQTSNQNVIRVNIRFDDAIPDKLASSYTRFFVLSNTAEEIAALYSNEIVGRRVRIDYTGSRPDQGIAHIDNPEGRGSIEKMSTLPAFGTLMAPAGKGD